MGDLCHRSFSRAVEDLCGVYHVNLPMLGTDRGESQSLAVRGPSWFTISRTLAGKIGQSCAVSLHQINSGIRLESDEATWPIRPNDGRWNRRCRIREWY